MGIFQLTNTKDQGENIPLLTFPSEKGGDDILKTF